MEETPDVTAMETSELLAARTNLLEQREYEKTLNDRKPAGARLNHQEFGSWIGPINDDLRLIRDELKRRGIEDPTNAD